MQKADERRKAIPKFRAQYGEENTVGLESLIHTDYQSSEHSDNGAVDEDEYKEHRRHQGAGDYGLERRREEWRSSLVSLASVTIEYCLITPIQLNRIYAILSRIAETEATAAATSDIGQSRSRAGRARYTRYHGLPANSNPRPPPARRTPFKSLVSQAWMYRSGTVSLPVFPDPPDYTILSIDIPDEDLTEADLVYYAEDEDDYNGDGEGSGDFVLVGGEASGSGSVDA